MVDAYATWKLSKPNGVGGNEGVPVGAFWVAVGVKTKPVSGTSEEVVRVGGRFVEVGEGGAPNERMAGDRKLTAAKPTANNASSDPMIVLRMRLSRCFWRRMGETKGVSSCG